VPEGHHWLHRSTGRGIEILVRLARRQGIRLRESYLRVAGRAKREAAQFVFGARSLSGNPYDSHTLAAQITQTERLTGVEIKRAYVDRGYRGHDADRARAILSGQKRGITPTIRRERRRRNAIEPVIGHLKDDGYLGRNFLVGSQGDAINLILAAAGHNPRLLRGWLVRLFAFLCSLLLAFHQSRPYPQKSALATWTPGNSRATIYWAIRETIETGQLPSGARPPSYLAAQGNS
jgi:hypothetical protein